MFKKILLPALITASLTTSTMSYASLFDISVSANGQTYQASFENAEESIDSFDTSNLDANLSNFNEITDAARGVLNYRGLEMIFEYTQNSPKVNFSVPSIGINETFDGATREESTDKLGDFLKSDGGEMLNKINKALASVSPTDPVAGNPNSLMARQVSSIHSGTISDTNTTTNKETFDTDNKFDLGVRLGKYQVNGSDVESIHLPLAYTFNFDSAPGHKLSIQLPVSYSRTNNKAETYSLGAGIAYTFPVNDNLSFTPGISYGAIGSVDLGSVAALESISLTTRYDFELFNQKWRFGNTLARVRTLELEFDDYAINPDLNNTIMVNGITWQSVPLNWLETEVFFTDTRYFGDELFSERSNEIGFAVATPERATYLKFKVGASYVFTDRSEVNGFKLNMGSSF